MTEKDENGFNIEEELKKLPASPGVYIMHDRHDEIIYVGKAISLKNRVRQYFQESRSKTAKIEKMVSRIARFEYIYGFRAGGPGPGVQSDQGAPSQVQHHVKG